MNDTNLMQFNNRRFIFRTNFQLDQSREASRFPKNHPHANIVITPDEAVELQKMGVEVGMREFSNPEGFTEQVFFVDIYLNRRSEIHKVVDGFDILVYPENWADADDMNDKRMVEYVNVQVHTFKDEERGKWLRLYADYLYIVQRASTNPYADMFRS